jgi:hypothetical protein
VPVKTIELSPTPKFIPSHVGGDRDFAGHGPKVDVSAWLRVVNRTQLWVQVWMRAQETRADWTLAEGVADYLVYEGSNDGVAQISRLISDRFSLATYEDTNHDDDVLNVGGAELVNRFVVTGDTGGDEAGQRTGVTVFFNPVEFEYEATQEPPPIVVRDLPPTPKFVPPHTGRGDRDFGGHGPRVFVSAELSIRNDNELWVRLFMSAVETRSDFTTAEGTTDFMIYRHSAPIANILSDVASSALYEDFNHEDDVITLGGTELVRQFVLTGDTRGNEAGSQSGVVAYFNPVTILE